MISFLRQLINCRPKPSQEFVHVERVNEGVVTLRDGTHCSIIEVKPVNMELLSDNEKAAVVEAYGNFVNSLNYSIQILVISRLVDIDQYLADLRSRKKAADKLLARQIEDYVQFVEQLVLRKRILSKRFYVIVPSMRSLSWEEARKTLSRRQNEVIIGLRRIGLSAQVLQDEAIKTVFYNLYNRRLSAYRWNMREKCEYTALTVQGSDGS